MASEAYFEAYDVLPPNRFGWSVPIDQLREIPAAREILPASDEVALRAFIGRSGIHSDQEVAQVYDAQDALAALADAQNSDSTLR